MSGDEDVRYLRLTRRRLLVILALLVVTVVLAIRSVSVMSFNISFDEALQVIMDGINGKEPQTYYAFIRRRLVFEGTFPRAIGGMLIGAILGISGAVMQYCVRNPLADPYTTGISSAALFGVSISLALGIVLVPVRGELGIICNALIFALVPCVIMLLITLRARTTSTMLVLIGIGVMYVFSSLTMVIKYNAEPEILAQIVEWSVGSLSKVTWDSIPFLVASLTVLLVSMVFLSRRLDVLASGDNMAHSLGVDPARLRMVCIVIVSVCTAIAVCFSGSIGFVGLIMPHLSRILVGSNSKLLIPCSAVSGALLLVFADTVSRMFGAQLPVGAITALIGAPLFLYFLFKIRTNGWGR